MLLKYFAYGSNMSVRRLKSRTPSATPKGTFILPKHDLRFHKSSNTDGSAKCDAFFTGRTEHKVFGVLFHLNKTEKIILDKIEGLGKGYKQKEVTIHTPDGKNETAFTYYATAINEKLKPFSWYVDHVLKGAKEAELPEEYLIKIRNTQSLEDHNTRRQQKELSIYS